MSTCDAEKTTSGSAAGGERLQKAAQTRDANKVVSGNAERGSCVSVDALVVHKHHFGRSNSKFRRNPQIDRRIRLQQTQLCTHEDTLEKSPNRRESQRTDKVETGVRQQRNSRSPLHELVEKIDSRWLDTRPAAKICCPEALDVGQAPLCADVDRNPAPIFSDAQKTVIQPISMRFVARPQNFGGNTGNRQQLVAILLRRGCRNNLPIIEHDNSTGDCKTHESQTTASQTNVRTVTNFTPWTATDTAISIAVPSESDDKYSRGVLGIITGSTQYPGAAVLGVEAALHTGVGMIRYLGPERAATLVLSRRPESVTANGRVQAWLIGSGMAALSGDPVGPDPVGRGSLGSQNESREAIADAIAQEVPVVLDGGALDLHASTHGPTVITPHFRELARVLDLNPADIANDPASAAAQAADKLGVTVLLKGHTTYIAAPDGTRLSTRAAPTWLATAGAGDALGGILGALVATHADEVVNDSSLLARLAASASVIHGLAAERASAGGPFTILDLTTQLPATISTLLAGIR